MEATLVPDLEHIRDLELRLEQEQRLADEDEAALADFQDRKRALDQRTTQLHRSKLHPLLRDRNLTSTTAALCRVDNDYSHLSVADQRLMSLMATSQNEDFCGSEMGKPLYNVRSPAFGFKVLFLKSVCYCANHLTYTLCVARSGCSHQQGIQATRISAFIYRAQWGAIGPTDEPRCCCKGDGAGTIDFYLWIEPSQG